MRIPTADYGKLPDLKKYAAYFKRREAGESETPVAAGGATPDRPDPQ